MLSRLTNWWSLAHAGLWIISINLFNFILWNHCCISSCAVSIGGNRKKKKRRRRKKTYLFALFSSLQWYFPAWLLLRQRLDPFLQQHQYWFCRIHSHCCGELHAFGERDLGSTNKQWRNKPSFSLSLALADRSSHIYMLILECFAHSANLLLGLCLENFLLCNCVPYFLLLFCFSMFWQDSPRLCQQNRNARTCTRTHTQHTLDNTRTHTHIHNVWWQSRSRR